jgi:hypothetical protein
MIELELEQLDEKLIKWRLAKKDWNKVKELVELSTAKGHSDGKWQPVLNINYQVAYQKNVGGTNYHNSEALNREIYQLLVRDLHKYLDEAILNIKTRYDESTCIR